MIQRTANRKSWMSGLRKLFLFGIGLVGWSFEESVSRAIDIDAVYDSANSQPHPDDPDGALLIANMERAIEIWKAAFPGITHDIVVTFDWKDDPTGFLGIGDADTELAMCKPGLLSNNYTIHFFTNYTTKAVVPWFLDSSPEDDVEFTRGVDQILRGEVPGGGGVTVTGAGAFASLPQALELGYVVKSAIADPPFFSFDLLSVALHELGHALGLNVVDSGIHSYYDVDPAFCHRFICTTAVGSCSIRIATSSSGAHLDVEESVMMGQPTGIRRYPSQVDILAVATANNWTSLNFPRVEMLPRTTAVATPTALVWDDSNSWFGNLIPGPDQDVNIRWYLISGVQMFADAAARNLNLGSTGTLASGALKLETDLHRLYASDSVTVDNSGTELLVEAGGLLEAVNKINVNGGATVRVNGMGQMVVLGHSLNVVDGDVYLDNGSVWTPNLFIESAGILQGSGDVVVSAQLENDGLIKASPDGLDITGQTPDTPLDLDGQSFAGDVEAVDGAIRLTGGFPDDFSGDMRVGKTIEFIQPTGWRLGTTDPRTATLKMEQKDAQIKSTYMDIGKWAQITVSAADTRFDTAVRFQGGKLNVTSTTSSLGLLGDTEYQSGSFTGLGTLHQVGDATVAANKLVTIGVGKFNWDGEKFLGTAPGDSRTTIESNGQLRITKQITNLSSDGYDGVAVVKKNATLRIDQAWKLDGDVCLDSGIMRGGTITVTSGGTIRGSGTINANVVNYGTIYCSDKIKITGTLTNLGTTTTTCPACP